MKVTILTEGGRNIGYGHITRCTSVYQAFEEMGITPKFIIHGDETVDCLLKGKNCEVFNWINKKKILFDAIEIADIVFIDSYLADYDLYEKISNTGKNAAYFDDDIRINYPKGYVINGAIGAEQMPYSKRKEVTYLLGAQYALLRREFWDVLNKPICDNIESILITFGGMDLHNLTPKVLKLLTEVYPKIHKKVIVAKCFQKTTEIENLKDNNTNLIYYPDAAEMKKAMLECDIAISACGQTLYELARIGIPTIGICAAENQLQNIEGWKKSGFLQYIGRHDDENILERIPEAINKLMPYKERNMRSQRGKKCVDGNGSARIVDKLLLGDLTKKP